MRYTECRLQTAKKKLIPPKFLTNRKEKLLYLRDSSELSLMIARWVNGAHDLVQLLTVMFSFASVEKIFPKLGLAQFNLWNRLGNER